MSTFLYVIGTALVAMASLSNFVGDTQSATLLVAHATACFVLAGQ